MKRFISTDPDKKREMVQERVYQVEETIAEIRYVLLNLPESLKSSYHTELSHRLQLRFNGLKSVLEER